MSQIVHKLALTEPTTTESEPDDVFLSTKDLARRIPFTAGTIDNLKSEHVLTEGVHFFKKRGRTVFSWRAVKAWVTATDKADDDTVTPFPNRRRS